jgi:5-methylcytosine-specific restriction endonuclease McrA
VAEKHLAQYDITQWMVGEGILGKDYKGKFYPAKKMKELLVILRPALEELVGKTTWSLDDMMVVRDFLGIKKRTKTKGESKPKTPPPPPKPKLTRKQKRQRAKERLKEREVKRNNLLTDSKYKTLTLKAKEYLNYDFIISNEFLSSIEWKRLRFAKMSTSNGRCACCGRTKDDDIYLTVDHIKPRRLFPELALDENNLQILCNICNEGKGNLSTQDFK